jgi:hypothetical protein
MSNGWNVDERKGKERKGKERKEKERTFPFFMV